MPARCTKCDFELPAERCLALIGMKKPLDQWECTECGKSAGYIVGFMGESSDNSGSIRNIGRKGGYVLTTLDPGNPNFKENLRRAQRLHRRAR